VRDFFIWQENKNAGIVGLLKDLLTQPGEKEIRKDAHCELNLVVS